MASKSLQATIPSGSWLICCTVGILSRNHKTFLCPKWDSSWVFISHYQVWVLFPEKSNWVGSEKQLVHTNDKAKIPYKGDKVQVSIEQKDCDYRYGEKKGNKPAQKRSAFLLDIKTESSTSTELVKDVKAVVQYANSTSEDRVPYKDITFYTSPQFKVRFYTLYYVFDNRSCICLKS